MICENCGTEIQDGSKFCPSCGVKLENTPATAETGNEPAAASTTDSTQPLLNDLKQAGTEKAKAVLGNYKNFKTLPKKKKILYITIPVILFLVVINLFSGGGTPSDKEVIDTAKYEVSKQVYSKNGPNLVDAKIVAADGHKRYIVSMTDDDTFDTDWVVWLEFDKSGEYYHKYCDYHGSYSSKYGPLDSKKLVDLFKTNSDFRWGEETWVRDE